MSIGYYDHHTADEYVILEDVENDIKIGREICASCLKQWGQAYPSKWTKNPITPEYESKYSNKKHVYLFLIAIFAI